MLARQIVWSWLTDPAVLLYRREAHGRKRARVTTVEFFLFLREITRELGIVLISDEIISFRLDYGGPQDRYGYQADLTTLGKIIGGGFPVGAFGGRADIMNAFDPARPAVGPLHGRAARPERLQGLLACVT